MAVCQKQLRLGEQYFLRGRFGREVIAKAHCQCTGGHNKEPGIHFAAHSNHRTFTSRSVENSNGFVRGMIFAMIPVSYWSPFEARPGTMIEPGACPRNNDGTEEKGKQDHQPGKFPQPVRNLSPPGQMTHLVERVA